MCPVQTNVSVIQYSYDGEGRRVEKTTGAAATVYVYDAAGNEVAQYSTQAQVVGGTEYVTADHLGSTRLVTNAGGTPVACHDYLPFGEELLAPESGRTGCYASVDGVTQKFTGKERDTETAGSATPSGLDYFGARYYSGAQGRFTSSDPTFITKARISDPQQLNLYAYARNNLLLYVDPNGREIVLFYRPPNPKKSSLGEFGHVFLYVRNDKTGRSGFFDYYPDPGKSAVHRTVDGKRIRDHAGLVIQSTPAAEDRMLDRMDALTAQDPRFHANAGEVLSRTESDCVSTAEDILKTGGIESSARTPTGLWEDLFGESGMDMKIGAHGIEATRTVPALGRLYGSEADRHFAALDELIDRAERQKEEAERKKKEQRP